MDLRDRTFEEKIADRLLLLYLIDKANLQGFKEGKTKLQKLIFVIEKMMNDNKVKGFNYNIIKWHYGPYSPELTEDGKKIVNRMKILIERNEYVIKAIDSIIQVLAKKTLDEILEMIYNAKVQLPNGKSMRIADIPEGTLMIEKLNEKNAKIVFTLPEEWIDTLDIMMRKKTYLSLKQALEMPANIHLDA